MARPVLLALSVFATSLACSAANAQIKHTTTPLADTLTKALAKSSLITPGSAPFHLRLTVAEPENPQSPYTGTVELWWQSPQQWRREVTGPESLHQLIVFTNGAKTEQDTGDYFPLWLSNFVTAITDPVPNASAWTASGANLDQSTLSDGRKSDACARAKSQIGSGDRATDAFSAICFDGDGRLKLVVSPRYGMNFEDPRSFQKKQVPRQLVVHPEPGTKLVGTVTILESLNDPGQLFAPLDRDENQLRSVTISTAALEQLTDSNPAITWPPVHSGNLQGRLAVYVGADSTGRVREVWPLNSDNAGLNDSARDQIRQWHLKPAKDKQGNVVAVDGGLGFAFTTTIGDPLPELSDTEVRALIIHKVDPPFAPGTLPSGTPVDVQVSIDQLGKLAGYSFHGSPQQAVGPLLSVLPQWTFRPYLRDGKPQYIHGTLHFVVP